jgi:hypothetical protein
VVSCSEVNILMTPRFSATKIRPSGENDTAVGCVRPEKTVSSWKSGGRLIARAGCANVSHATVIASSNSPAVK